MLTLSVLFFLSSFGFARVSVIVVIPVHCVAIITLCISIIPSCRRYVLRIVPNVFFSVKPSETLKDVLLAETFNQFKIESKLAQQRSALPNLVLSPTDLMSKLKKNLPASPTA